MLRVWLVESSSLQEPSVHSDSAAPTSDSVLSGGLLLVSCLCSSQLGKGLGARALDWLVLTLLMTAPSWSDFTLAAASKKQAAFLKLTLGCPHVTWECTGTLDTRTSFGSKGHNRAFPAAKSSVLLPAHLSGFFHGLILQTFHVCQFQRIKSQRSISTPPSVPSPDGQPFCTKHNLHLN